MVEQPRATKTEMRWGPAAIVFAVSGLLVLAALETTSRLLATDRYYVWPPGFSARFDPDPDVVSGVSFPARLTINSLGMRGDPPKDSGQYRLLTVGGSTTICVYLDDSRVWPYLVQERVNAALGRDALWVGNVGRPGHTTVQHVLQVEKLLHQDPGIDAVVLLIGINDLLIYLSLSGHPIAARSSEQRNPVGALSAAFSLFPGSDEGAPWYLRNFAGRAWRRMRWRPLESTTRLPAMDEKGEFLQMLRGYRKRAGSLRQTLPDLTAALAAYTDRVNQIIDLAREAGVRVTLLTQPTLWREGLSVAELDRLWAGGPPLDRLENGAAYYSAEALSGGMRRYNQALLAICREREVDCLDVAQQMPQNTAVFYDDAHFTERGSAMLAELIAGHLLEREPLRPSGAGH